MIRHEQDLAFRAEIEHMGSYVCASYRVISARQAHKPVYSDTRIFSSRITAKAWLDDEARRRGFESYPLGDASTPVAAEAHSH